MNLEFHPEAVAEARAARMWYLERSPATAEAFINELDIGIERILSNPEMRSVYVAGLVDICFDIFPSQLFTE